MPKEEPIEIEGVVSQALANTQIRVKLDGGHEIIALFPHDQRGQSFLN